MKKIILVSSLLLLGISLTSCNAKVSKVTRSAGKIVGKVK